MIESPVLRDLIAENVQDMIRALLEDRFGSLPPDVVTALRAVTDLDRPKELNKLAARSPDLEAFRQHLV